LTGYWQILTVDKILIWVYAYIILCEGVCMEYQEFVASKKETAQSYGFDYKINNEGLYPFQRHIAEWALKKGRAAIFADTGLGKTRMQLAWADAIIKHDGGNVLIFAPLCVAAQTICEGQSIGIDVNYCRSQEDVKNGVNITNYEMLHHFNVPTFTGVVLDESSILKSYMGKTKQALIEACLETPYRLACTATPSPNDYLELGNHSQWLGIMPSNEMIMRFFANDTMQAGGYSLKPHAKNAFWEWVASWAVAISNPSQMGYDGSKYVLPELNQVFKIVEIDNLPPTDGELFRVANLNATSVHREGRLTIETRALELSKIINASDETWLVWCNTDYEADALKAVIPGAVECRGSHTIAQKEKALTGFSNGEIRVLLTKPSIAGFGMNWQHCHNMAFVGLSYSYEDYYQAIRRCWRFGQQKEVNVFIMASASETPILETIKRKEEEHNKMKSEMSAVISGIHTKEEKVNADPYFKCQRGNDWELHHGDCVHVAKMIPDEEIDFSVYSPPFSNLYIYSDSVYDMGNSFNDNEFMKHYGYLVKELYRITRPGRLTAIHCKDLPMYKGRDGSAGLRDFPGEIIRLYESFGWVFHSRVTIWKDPVIEMQRTKNHGLLYKQLCKDSAASRQGMADYIIVMRKWDDETKWKPVTTGGERFYDYIGSTKEREAAMMIHRNNEDLTRLRSINIWQRYASPVWFDINQTNVLNKKYAKDIDEERHICPLQLDVIERCVELWSNPRELVFSPFTGIGSEGFVSLKMNRRFIGAELKEGYFNEACKNLQEASVLLGAQSFDF
jgi:DNA modification methylase